MSMTRRQNNFIYFPLKETQINATDADIDVSNRNIRYSLEGRSAEMFTIDPLTASIAVRTPGSLDSETRSSYEMSVSNCYTWQPLVAPGFPPRVKSSTEIIEYTQCLFRLEARTR